jgi:two-component system, NarL family, sensor histidine kinase DevS
MGIDASEQTLRRWAQRLHDEPLQGIGAVRMRLAAARKGPNEDLADAVDTAIGQLAIEIAGLRSLIAELRPAALDELGLVDALRGLCELYSEAGLAVEMDLSLGAGADIHGGLDPEAESAIFRVVQEALADAATHPEAGSVAVRLRGGASEAVLTVNDAGAGVTSRRLARARGLERLRERIETLGGALVVSSAAGGTRVEARLPVAAEAEAQLASPSISPRSSA